MTPALRTPAEPDGRFDATPPLVRDLVVEQGGAALRAAAHAGVEPVALGWDNAVFRLGGPGGRFVARLPRRESAVELILKEERWLGEVTAPVRAGGVRTPEGVLAGRPGAGYPWPWAVLTWLEGEPVSDLAVEERSGLAGPLADALARLHRPSPPDAPANPYRGVPLSARAERADEVWPAVRTRVGGPAAEVLEAAWRSGLAAPEWDRAPVWVHGDPHPANLVHRAGADLGVLDFGDLTAGDPACDVAAAWLTFDARGRETFLDVLHDRGSYDDAVDRRAVGWAALVAARTLLDAPGDERVRALAGHVVSGLGG